MSIAFYMIVAGGVVCYLSGVLLLWFAKDVVSSRKGVEAWQLSSLAGAFGYSGLLVSSEYAPLYAEGIYNLAMLLWSAFLYLGSHYWLDRAVNKKYILCSAAVFMLWAGYFQFVKPDFKTAAIAVALYSGLLNLHLGWIFFRYSSVEPVTRSLLVGCLVISGLHWLDYPFLRYVDQLGAMGFLLCAILSVVISVLIVKMVIRSFQQLMVKAEQDAIDRSMHDQLTGLRNRLYLESEFHLRAEQARKNNRVMALVFCDLDNFKPINDVFGHLVGDQVLIVFAQRIRSLIRHSDIASRLGGDEFVVLLADLGPEFQEHAGGFLSRLSGCMANPVVVSGYKHYLGVSVGVAYYHPEQDEPLFRLLEIADQSMYADKLMKKNQRAQSVAQPPAQLMHEALPEVRPDIDSKT